MTKWWRSEPALILAAVQAVLAALVIPDAWAKAVLAVAALALGAATRSQVYSPASVDELTARSRRDP